MKQILEKCLSQYKALRAFIKSERWLNITNGLCIIFCAFGLFFLLCMLFLEMKMLWFGCTGFVITLIILILLFEHKSHALWFLTKKRFSSATELFTQFTHTSFLYVKMTFAGAEFDMVIFSDKTNSCECNEIKHSDQIVEHKTQYLTDEECLKETEWRFGPITKRLLFIVD